MKVKVKVLFDLKFVIDMLTSVTFAKVFGESVLVLMVSI